MLFTNNEGLEDRVVRRLIKGEFSVSQIQKLLKTESQKYSIQSIYAVLRRLVALEVVVKRGTIYYLNQEWKKKVVDRLQARGSLEIAEGESVSYNLFSLASSDLQWKNIVLPLHQQKPDEPIFFYNYHYIWTYLSESRKNSEREYFSALTKNKTNTFCLIGSTSPQDREVKRMIQNDFVRVTLGKKIMSERDCMTIFGDYMITTSFLPSLVREIEKGYKQSPNVPALETLLYRLNIEKKRIRLIIERNHEKAKKIRKKFSTEFYIPKELTKKFDLY